MSIHVEVTADDIAAAARIPDVGDGFKSAHPESKDPVELAIARVAGRDACLDSDGPDDDEIATIGDGRTVLVVSTAPTVGPWIERYYRGEIVEPFAFDIEVEDWLVKLLRAAS